MATIGNNDILHYLKAFLKDEQAQAVSPRATDFFPWIMYVFDGLEKKVKVINESKITEFLGYSAEEISAWGNDYMQMIFRDDWELVMQEIEKCYLLQDDDHHAYQCRLNHKEGDWRHFHTRGAVLNRDSNGRPVSWVFVADDITDKMKTQEEILALKTLVDDTEEMLFFGSWSWDLRIDKIYWTSGMYKLLDYEKKDVEPSVSSGFYFNHVHADDVSRVKATIRHAIDTNTDFDIKYNIHTRTKEEKIVSTKGKTIKDSSGTVVKAIGITRDITKQTNINRDLVHYKEMIHEKEEFLNQGSWETSLPDETTTWSKGMYRLFGYDPEKDMDALRITNEFQFDHMSDEEIRRHREDWQNTLMHGKDNFIREVAIEDKNGNVKKLETYGKVIRDSNHNATKIIGTTRDVTQLREYEKGLEEKIQELNQHNTELEDFAYIASHDLQEPLRKLSTFSERLRSKFSNLLGEEGIVYLDRIVVATENMRVLIENLLEFSRTARSDKHFSQRSLTQLLEEVKADLELKIEETGTQINNNALPVMEVIPIQIKQLFENLLSNSIKFKRQNHQSVINILCSELTNTEKLHFKLADNRVYYKIEIADNGIGFEKEYAERIFKIFQRLHGKSEYPGSGIGLAICKKIVENHHGIIFAKSDPGNGASFTIILPESQS